MCLHTVESAKPAGTEGTEGWRGGGSGEQRESWPWMKDADISEHPGVDLGGARGRRRPICSTISWELRGKMATPGADHFILH
ncbi:hypothetical protein EYF80_024719 [Liparis tanakae]|uniref:Uncharacterized protein n=1 Tax=Liparis tanakae TaxID=230148 RepID=A0A4Z2HHU6_9TELE|nr:hypothetical protein EYF80_024719 [Liparis tanakae]